jgi:hypothetical protein
MLGLTLAALYVGWQLIAYDNMSGEVAFLNAATFLYYWYCVWSIIIGVFVGGISLLMILGIGANFAELNDSCLGKVAGFFGGAAIGGGLSVLLFTFFSILCALYIVGAYLLMTAGTPDMAFADFNMVRLVVGGILLLIAIFARSMSSSSSSKND